MDLYLVRHGIAENHGVRPDAERALTEQGRAKMKRAARGLRSLGVQFDMILTSPLRRARETAEIMAAELGGVKIEEIDELKPGIDPRRTLQALGRFGKCKSLALVGHQPHLGEFAALMLTGSPSGCTIEFKKGGVACAEVDLSTQPVRAILEAVMTPKMLRLM